MKPNKVVIGGTEYGYLGVVVDSTDAVLVVYFNFGTGEILTTAIANATIKEL